MGKTKRRNDIKREGKRYNAATDRLYDRVVPGCRHVWTPWARSGVFSSIERRDCEQCGRIQTRPVGQTKMGRRARA